MTAIPHPGPWMARNLERLARTELSLRARLGHVLLSLVASALTIVVISLWVTEPALPARTHVAFGLLTVIGVAWVAYSAWVLRARRTMLAVHRVVAGRLSVAFSGAFTAGCLLLALATDVAGALPAFAMGLVFVVVAVSLWRRAEVHYATLRARRDALERELKGCRR